MGSRISAGREALAVHDEAFYTACDGRHSRGGAGESFYCAMAHIGIRQRSTKWFIFTQASLVSRPLFKFNRRVYARAWLNDAHVVSHFSLAILQLLLTHRVPCRVVPGNAEAASCPPFPFAPTKKSGPSEPVTVDSRHSLKCSRLHSTSTCKDRVLVSNHNAATFCAYLGNPRKGKTKCNTPTRIETSRRVPALS